MGRPQIFFFAVLLSLLGGSSWALEAPELASPETKTCIACHRVYTPGIVGDWLESRHSKVTPWAALKKPKLERRVSAEAVPETQSKFVVGCFECHGQNPEAHKDNFQHMGFRINVVVSPGDCKTCHPAEVKQYSGSKKAQANLNLIKNPVYSLLVDTITSLKEAEGSKVIQRSPSDFTRWETCLACHGTEVRVRGMKKVETEMGVIEVPDLENWPNQGVGRINPDGTRGACTPCHPRHAFSLRDARRPYTCSQCHLDPDVPAWDVYHESKHGNIFEARGGNWNFDSVPWTLGKDFKAPTCSTCHNALVVDPQGTVLAERTHDFGARLWVRLFGLIYSHPQPKSGATYEIRNPDGLPLPTTFDGRIASEYLIDAKEQARRKSAFQKICKGCHNTDWVQGHFEKFENTVRETDRMVLAATKLMLKAWETGKADKENPFDEEVEQLWIRQWLFYANSIRYASAMTGAPDYATFKHGWWYLTETLQKLKGKLKE